MKSKAIALLLVTGMLLAGFTGCSGTKAADTETMTFMGQVTAIDNNTITLALGEQTRSSDGMKQNANATSTSSTDSDTQPSAPPDGAGNGGPGGQSGNGGTPPARPDGKTSGSAMGTAPQGGGQASSSTGGQAPSSAEGQASSSGGQAPAVDGTPSNVASSGGLTLTGKTKEITVSDSTSVMIDNAGTTTKAALSDIKVGSVLSVTITGDTVTEIIITSAQTISPVADNAE